MTSDAPAMSPADGWTDLCALAEVPSEGGHYVEHNHRAFAVMRFHSAQAGPGAENIRVIDDHCPHAGGSLSAGAIMDGCVICPWHAWPFDLTTGKCPDADAYQVRVYESRVVDGRVWVRI